MVGGSRAVVFPQVTIYAIRGQTEVTPGLVTIGAFSTCVPIAKGELARVRVVRWTPGRKPMAFPAFEGEFCRAMVGVERRIVSWQMARGTGSAQAAI